MANAGKEIQLGMYPEALGPMIFTFTGAGNVSQVYIQQFTLSQVLLYPSLAMIHRMYVALILL